MFCTVLGLWRDIEDAVGRSKNTLIFLTHGSLIADGMKLVGRLVSERIYGR